MEKWVLRKAFDDEENPYLPKVIKLKNLYADDNFLVIPDKSFTAKLRETNLAMQHILYRQKEQFSDGVGYSWIDGLKAHAEEHVIYKVTGLFLLFDVKTYQ